MAKGKTSNKKRVSTTSDFLTVGIGASAGGIKALREFFAIMPPDSGMAFVVILHLSKAHKSSLAEILQRETKMPVEQVGGTVTVAPNRVYVIPPAKHLEMVDGIITLKEPPQIKGVRVPIDRFFRTLALAYGRKAVCIILSGTGSDGTMGMKHIKDRGGFAMIQDPVEAEYDGMPRSAIETKIADVVLPIAAMPEKLLFVRDTTEKFRLTDGDDGAVGLEIKNIDLLRDVLTLLRIRTGHDFSNYKRPTLIRRLARHLQIYETDDLEEYLEILRKKPDEVLSLLKNLLINVTNFFRDKESFDTLQKKVIPALFTGKGPGDQVRVWIAGCSTGEEAYSIAMLLSEYAAALADPPKIQVFASDVDEDVIAEAREGRFTEASVADISAERLQQFFMKEEDNTYRVRKSIREMILFAPHNILRDPPFSRLDLISCRNVLIYLNRETQEQILKIYHFALQEGGYLFLGSSETAESTPAHFSAIDKKYRIYQCRPSGAGWHQPPALPLTGGWMPKLQQQSPGTRGNLQSFGELHHRLIEHYAPPSVLVNEEGEILHLSESAGRFLRFAGGETTVNIMKVIHPDLLSDLRAALFTARKENKTVEAKNIPVKFNGDASTGSATTSTSSATEKRVNIMVRPVGTPEAAALVMFEETVNQSQMEESTRAIIAGDKAMEAVVRRMEEELKHTKVQLRNTIEQYETSTEELKASNEELQAINEELRSASEELETSKEELQSVNEELTTVNNELKDKVDETARTNSDLQNLIQSTNIATIFLDRALHIKRYTPRATEIFNLIPTDVGRPISHITHRLDPDNFQPDAAKSLQSLQTFEREVRSVDGRFFMVRFSPYRTLDDKIEGVVISFIDITEREKAAQLVREERAYARAIIETVWEPLIILDKDLRVMSASSSFYETFKVKPEETEGKFIFDLGNRQWDIPALRRLLEEILPEHSQFRDFKVEHTFEGIGRRTMLLNAREIRRMDEGRRLILLAMDDNSEQKKAKERQAYLLKLNDAIQSLSYPADIEEIVTQITMNYFGADRCYYCEIKDGNAIIRRDAARENLSSVAGMYPLSDSALFKAIVDAGRPVIVNDIHTADIIDEELRQLCFQLEVISFVGVPVIKNGKAAGIFCLMLSTPRDWTDQEAVLVSETAEYIWKAVEKSKTEEALRKSEEKYRTLVTSLPVGIYTCNADGRILFFNETAVKLWGHTPDLEDESLKYCACDKVWMMDGTFVPPERTPMAAALKTGRSFRNVEAVVQRTDGKKFYASLNVDPLFDEAGKIKGTINIFQDISNIKEAEIALRESQKQLARDLADMQQLQYISNQLIQENNIDVLYGQILDTLIALMHSDAGSLQIYHPERNELRLLAFRGFHPESAKFWEWVRMDSKSTCGMALNTHDRVIVTDIEGSDFIAGSEDEPFYRLSGIRSVQSTPLISRDGKLVGMISTHWHKVHQPSEKDLHLLNVLARQAADLIERWRSEEALRRSEENYRIMINQAVAGIIQTDPSGNIIFANKRFEKMLGYSNEELLQMTLTDIVYEEDRARHTKMFGSIKEDRQGYVIEKRLVRKDGSCIWVHNYNSPIFTGDSSLQSVAIISVDISAQKAMEKQKDEFISVASHELKTPLTSIKVYAELLQEVFAEDDDTPHMDLMKKLNAQINRLARLVSGLLDTTRISAGQFALQPETFDLNQLLEERAAEAQFTAPNHKLIVEPGNVAPLHADRDRIGQVVTNLISNAVKYSPEANRIIISSVHINNEVRVNVRDFGIGLQPENRQKIFERFYREGHSGDSAGLGLGLYISMEIIKMHGGTMGVENPPAGEVPDRGKGSVFYFTLPING